MPECQTYDAIKKAAANGSELANHAVAAIEEGKAAFKQICDKHNVMLVGDDTAGLVVEAMSEAAVFSSPWLEKSVSKGGLNAGWPVHH